jgi:hypothetical protein
MMTTLSSEAPVDFRGVDASIGDILNKSGLKTDEQVALLQSAISLAVVLGV